MLLKTDFKGKMSGQDYKYRRRIDRYWAIAIVCEALDVHVGEVADVSYWPSGYLFYMLKDGNEGAVILTKEDGEK